MSRLIRWALAILLIVHGSIHILGFLTAWELAEIETLGGPSFLLGGLDQDSGVVLAFGLLWLVAMFGFVGSGVGIALDTAWATGVAKASAFVSLVVTIPWWSDAWIGTVVSAVILVALLVEPVERSLSTGQRRMRDAGSATV